MSICFPLKKSFCMGLCHTLAFHRCKRQFTAPYREPGSLGNLFCTPLLPFSKGLHIPATQVSLKSSSSSQRQREGGDSGLFPDSVQSNTVVSALAASHHPQAYLASAARVVKMCPASQSNATSRPCRYISGCRARVEEFNFLNWRMQRAPLGSAVQILFKWEEAHS